MIDLKLSYIDIEVVNFCSYIIKKYMDSNKGIDEKFIIECVEVIKDIKGLEDYVKNIEFNNNTKDTANYHQILNDLTFNIDKILKGLEEDKEHFNNKLYNFKNTDYEIFKYIRVLITILHELEHANQCKIIKTEDSLESKILTASFETSDKLSNELIKQIGNKDFIKKNILIKKFNKCQKLYQKFYRFAPEERMAYIKSHYLSLKIANSHEMDYLKKWLELETSLFAQEAYIEKSNPTSFYLSKINPKSNRKELEEMGKNLDLNYRILYGLNLDADELDNFVDEVIEKHKSLIKK